MLKFLRILWQLPQCLLAYFLILTRSLKYKENINDRPIYSGNNITYGVSLGEYIIIGDIYYQSGQDPCVNNHEWGHTRQSLILGPLYLIIVGIPSATMNMMSSYSFLHGSKKFYKNYYK